MIKLIFQFITFQLTLNSLFQTVKSEGPRALYKGFCPTWVRLGPWNIIVSFLVQYFYSVFKNIFKEIVVHVN